MGVNVVLFLIFQWALEPWRRGRLVRGFEEKVKAVLENEKARDRESSVIDQETKVFGRPNAQMEDSQEGLMTSDSTAQMSDSSMVDANSMPVLNLEVTDVSASDTTDSLAATDVSAPVDHFPLHFSDWVSAPLESSKAAIQRLFSTNLVSIRQLDLTSARIEGAMVGIAFASIVAAIIRTAR